MEPYAGYGIRSADLQSFSYGGSSYTITQPVVENRSAFEEKNDDFLVSLASCSSSARKRKGRFIGVRQKGGKWVAEIRDRDKKSRLWLGSFNSAEEAAVAYDLEARRIRGAKANLNFPNGIPDFRILLSARQTCSKTRRRRGKSWLEKAKQEQEQEEESQISSSSVNDESSQGLQEHDDQVACDQVACGESDKRGACSREIYKDSCNEAEEDEEEDILQIILRLKTPDESFDMWNFEAQVSQESAELQIQTDPPLDY